MAKTEQKGTAIIPEIPKQKCNDVKCPFHGNLRVRGRQFTGVIVSTKMRKTAVIEFNRLHFLKKYERYEKRRTRLKIHNPECISVKDGDIVRIMECRPLSKTKNFVIIEKMGTERGFKEKMEAREAGKIMLTAKTEDEAKSKVE
ncbi:30S ribosomal protein S17 [Candidatus Woesearchaeota archaeon]|nr:30S ribosomal protein S17 [Candidatus Woesearchaeota archaeon]